MSAELETMMRDYKFLKLGLGVTQLELAVQEHKIWDQLKFEHGAGLTKSPEIGERREWFVRQFGGRPSTYDNRFTIYKAGSWAHRLFDLVDQETLSLGAAKDLVSEAKIIAKRKQISPADALLVALEAGDSSSPLPQPGVHQALPPMSTGSLRDFHRAVTTLAEAHLGESLADISVDHYHKQTLIDDFRDSLDILIREFGRKISQVKGDTRLASKRNVGAVRFNWACEVLGLRYEWGVNKVDMRMVKARKNKRVLDLHPDRNPDNPAARKELERVLEAYDILEQYTGGSTRSSNA